MKVWYVLDKGSSGYNRIHIFTGKKNPLRSTYITVTQSLIRYGDPEIDVFTRNGEDAFMGLSVNSPQEWELAKKKLVEWIFTGVIDTSPGLQFMDTEI